MASKRSHEGYLLIDNRFGPGVSAEFVRRSGKEAPIVPEGALYESATVTCAHCHAVVVLRPDRTRERHYCATCDHYICDGCAVTYTTLGCTLFVKRLDLLQERAFKQQGQDDTRIVLP